MRKRRDSDTRRPKCPAPALTQDKRHRRRAWRYLTKVLVLGRFVRLHRWRSIIQEVPPRRWSASSRAPHDEWATCRWQVSWLTAQALNLTFPTQCTSASVVFEVSSPLTVAGAATASWPRPCPCSLFTHYFEIAGPSVGLLSSYLLPIVKWALARNDTQVACSIVIL